MISLDFEKSEERIVREFNLVSEYKKYGLGDMNIIPVLSGDTLPVLNK